MEQFEQQLQTLWQQGGRDIALSFLQRAVNLDMPLGKLLAALKFGDVSHHLGSITLREVLLAGRSAGASRPAAPTSPPAHSAAERSKPGRRKRRSADELSTIKKLLAISLRDEPGSLNTTQLVATMRSQGHDLDSMKINALLRGLLEDDLVVDLGGKPKSWRATAKLREAGAASSG